MLKTLKELKSGVTGGVVSRLSKRCLIHVEGTNTYEYLNGLVTNKILKNDETAATYAAFLTGKGRLLADVMFYHRPSLQSYFVEISGETSQEVLDHLKKYKLRQKVFIDPAPKDTHDIWTILATNIEWRDNILRNLLNRGDLGLSMGVYVDPRWELCIRVITPKGSEPPLDGLDLIWERDSQKTYDYFRALNGFPEGHPELPCNKQIPLEANMQDFNGVHFSKGCYLGQELIARTYHRGEIRKRVLPLRKVHGYAGNSEPIYCKPTELIPDGFLDGLADVDDKAELLDGVDIKWGGQKTRGTVVAGHWNVVLGVIRLEHLQQENLFSIGGEEGAAPDWQVIFPSWWSDKVLSHAVASE